MTLTAYLIQKSEIESNRLIDFVECYLDVNGHIELDEIEPSNLITIVTDQKPENIALELRVLNNFMLEASS